MDFFLAGRSRNGFLRSLSDFLAEPLVAFFFAFFFAMPALRSLDRAILAGSRGIVMASHGAASRAVGDAVGHLIALAISLATRLGIPELVGRGPRRVAALARATGSHPDTLYRVMRALAAVASSPSGRPALRTDPAQ